MAIELDRSHSEFRLEMESHPAFRLEMELLAMLPRYENRARVTDLIADLRLTPGSRDLWGLVADLKRQGYAILEISETKLVDGESKTVGLAVAPAGWERVKADTQTYLEEVEGDAANES